MGFQLWGLFLAFVLIVNAGAVGLMLSAFGIVLWRGGWDAAMQAAEAGRWPIARKLMVSGASLGLVFCFLYLLLAAWGKLLLDGP
ncbi:MAG TPA: hypothetical protein VFV87_15840 [Pirellulaceae bacterium]|nr:hypothetical protein [Pirellulaceae bacterium]